MAVCAEIDSGGIELMVLFNACSPISELRLEAILPSIFTYSAGDLFGDKSSRNHFFDEQSRHVSFSGYEGSRGSCGACRRFPSSASLHRVNDSVKNVRQVHCCAWYYLVKIKIIK